MCVAHTKNIRTRYMHTVFQVRTIRWWCGRWKLPEVRQETRYVTLKGWCKNARSTTPCLRAMYRYLVLCGPFTHSFMNCVQHCLFPLNLSVHTMMLVFWGMGVCCCPQDKSSKIEHMAAELNEIALTNSRVSERCVQLWFALVSSYFEERNIRRTATHIPPWLLVIAMMLIYSQQTTCGCESALARPQHATFSL
jgi:hypothetical protein